MQFKLQCCTNIGKYKVKWNLNVRTLHDIARNADFVFGFSVAPSLLEYFIVMIREPHTHSFFRISYIKLARDRGEFPSRNYARNFSLAALVYHPRFSHGRLVGGKRLTRD